MKDVFNNLLLLLVCVLPILLILFYSYKRDKEKEPLRLLLSFFCLGLLSCFLVVQISNFLTPIIPFMNMRIGDMSFLDKVLYTFIGVALIEEACKWVMVYFIGYHNKEFDELYDIMIYAIFVSLGFALYENIIYVFQNSSIRIALLRAVSAIPGHACDAIFMGYYLSMAKVFFYKKRKKLENNNILLSILIPILLHGVYDFCLIMISNSLTGNSKIIVYSACIIIFSVFITTLFVNSYRRIKEISNINPRIKR